jgi:hypothetical protein
MEFDTTMCAAFLRASLRGRGRQEPVLFDGSITYNITLGNPGITTEQIEAAARTAYAHQFVTELPDAYDTEVGERGAQVPRPGQWMVNGWSMDGQWMVNGWIANIQNRCGPLMQRRAPPGAARVRGAGSYGARGATLGATHVWGRGSCRAGRSSASRSRALSRATPESCCLTRHPSSPSLPSY